MLKTKPGKEITWQKIRLKIKPWKQGKGGKQVGRAGRKSVRIKLLICAERLRDWRYREPLMVYMLCMCGYGCGGPGGCAWVMDRGNLVKKSIKGL